MDRMSCFYRDLNATISPYAKLHLEDEIAYSRDKAIQALSHLEAEFEASRGRGMLVAALENQRPQKFYLMQALSEYEAQRSAFKRLLL